MEQVLLQGCAVNLVLRTREENKGEAAGGRRHQVLGKTRPVYFRTTTNQSCLIHKESKKERERERMVRFTFHRIY